MNNAEHTHETAAEAGTAVDYFYRTESNRLAPEDFHVYCQTIIADDDMTVEEAIRLAPQVIGRKGSSRAGCFEIQTGLGIVQHTTGKNLVHSIDRRGAASVDWKTWDEIDDEDMAGI